MKIIQKFENKIQAKMKIGIKIIVLIMLLFALISLISGDNLMITVFLLWLAHIIRFADDGIE